MEDIYLMLRKLIFKEIILLNIEEQFYEESCVYPVYKITTKKIEIRETIVNKKVVNVCTRSVSSASFQMQF